MGKRTPVRAIWMRGASRLVLANLATAFLSVSGLPAHAHGGEQPRPAKADAALPVTPAPTEHPSEGHVHAEMRLEAEANAEAGVHAEASTSAHAYPPEGVPRPLAWLGKFHPLLVHFPVALLTMAAFAELLLIRRPQEMFRHAVRFCVWAGAIGAVASAPLGWFFAGFRFVDDEWVMTAHRWAGTASAFWALGILYVVERVERGETGGARTGLRAALFAGAVGVGATGFLGGALIYGLDHFAW